MPKATPSQLAANLTSLKPHLAGPAAARLSPLETVVFALVAFWARRHPALASRLDRAAELVLAGRVERKGDGWRVANSQGGHHIVTVTLVRDGEKVARRGRCSCPDFNDPRRQGPDHRCKHALAAALRESADKALAVYERAAALDAAQGDTA